MPDTSGTRRGNTSGKVNELETDGNVGGLCRGIY